jgi:hypothetical protein
MNFVLTRISQRPFAGLLLIYAVVLAVNGFGITDWWDYNAAVTDIAKIRLTVDRQFLYSSPLNFFLGALLHLNFIGGFYLLNFIEIIGMLFCVAISVRKKIALPQDQARFIALLSLAPLWLVTFKWFGKTDPIVIGGLFLCWAYRTRWRLLIATVMIVAHREIGSLMVAFLFFLEDEKDYNLLIALLAGNTFHFVYQYGVLDAVPQSRAELISEVALQYVNAFTDAPGFYTGSLFTWYWVLILLNRPTRKETIVFILCFLAALPCNDFTRDFLLPALPAVLVHLERVIAAPDNKRLTNLFPLCLFQYQTATHVPPHFYDNIFLLWIKAGLAHLAH